MSEEPQHKKIETFSEDMVKALEHPDEGLIKKIIEDQEKHDEDRKNFSPESSKNKLFMLVGGLLLLVAVSTLSFVLLNRDFGAVSVKPQFSPLIFTDSNKIIEIKGLSKEKIAQAVLDEIKISEVKSGGIEGIYLAKNKKAIGLPDFMNAIQANIDIKKNGFFNNNFLLGIKNGGNKDLFLLIKVRSLFDVFPDIRAWESKMFSDLFPFWGIDINSENAYLLTKNFEDGIAQNKNARILYNNNKEIVLMYVYLDDTSILITNSEIATKEVIQRLASSRVQK